METAAALSSIFQVYQAKNYHHEEMSKAQDFFRKEMVLTKLAAARERERDEHSMISQRIQTLIVMQSLFFGAACAFVIEGQLPEQANSFIVFFYSAFLALSQVLLLISLVTSLRMQNVMSNFKIMDTERIMSIKGKVHNYYVNLCKPLEKKSIDLFLVGSVFLMFDSGLLWYSRLMQNFKSDISASYVYASILGGGIVFYIYKLMTVKKNIQHIALTSSSMTDIRDGQDNEDEDGYHREMV